LQALDQQLQLFVAMGLVQAQVHAHGMHLLAVTGQA
jgi:hypothetical protein